MKIAVIGKIKEDVDKLKGQIKLYGYNVAEDNPDIVVSFGGDGSFLMAERLFPSIPKLMIRNKSICNKCNEGKLKDVLRKLRKKEYIIKEYYKVIAEIRKGSSIIRKTAINEISIRNKEPYHALRFVLEVNNKKINKEFIGDGIVVATAFGSTGYFYSITKKSFREGIGIAFNNTTRDVRPLVGPNLIIRLRVMRNKAVVSADNEPEIVEIDEGDIVEVRKSNEAAKVAELGGFEGLWKR